MAGTRQGKQTTCAAWNGATRRGDRIQAPARYPLDSYEGIAIP